MISAFILLFLVCFAVLTWFRFSVALVALFALLPFYLIRYALGPLPTTLLENMIWIILIIFAIQHRYDYQKITIGLEHIKKNTLAIGIALFLLAATVSLLTAVNMRSAAGVWKAFFIEPFLIFLIIIFTAGKKTAEEKNLFVARLIGALLFVGLATSLFAIYQHFTGFLVPYAFWENRHTYRVTGWYGFPNAVGLFLAPLIPLAMFQIHNYWRTVKDRSPFLFFMALLFIPAAILAIFFAQSTGGLIGAVGGIGFLLLVYKKTRWPAAAIGIVGIMALFLLPAANPLKQELLFQDRSGQIRIAIYAETLALLKERPVFGAGLASYSERIAPYHRTVNGEGIEIFHHPHNILLTMWVNIGILGLIGFLMIIFWFFRTAIFPQQKYSLYTPFLLSSMTALLITGLVDSPYMKNDLALFFWLLLAGMVVSPQKSQTTSS
ncbi:MAG TPA: hypothetical protein DCY48_02750 [Candidatus Magasanikbacteria bacterium]|nr:MAG: hypothetical protein A3I74_02110 [Candidatus Magasanikbacteria bacterium RIFCSPLOWO2_02_FULL_47_16]OGH79691.1 MAG: hypothetical protein A3C10_01295 [Candidatus Magasanikbacteria bacterium RIFCSPHIGHO2_02_FULL_48_18]OGH82860.1 MAG: hypothetical protein A3G08_00820 [Candidatus Magasanikbacteria bacterium RIFCSPLOWO2_12_FULL_47_9b]HAZ28671.1 hypothetical protein [Candidatus Magasanikbacteria bacterium]